MALFDPQRHEALAGAPWSEAAARAAITAIAADAEAAFDARAYWPIHPMDVSPERPAALKPLYNGAAGVIWALTHLEHAGAIELQRDYFSAAERLVAANEADVASNPMLAAYVGPDRSSFLGSAFGMRALEWRLAPTPDRAARMTEDVRTKQGDARGLYWGAAGTMIGALLLHEATGSAIWRDAYERHFAVLWSERSADGFWRTELYGDEAVRIGALHGYFANAYAILRGAHLLAPAMRERAYAAIHAAFTQTALREKGLANWPYTAEGLGAGPGQQRYVQFCVGAPGIIAAMAQFPRDARWPVDDLLCEGGELIWRAGPIAKLPGICHGVAGAAYAFLKLHARTGDALWLTRARAFAMHGLAQSNAALAADGVRKYAVWTGDLGLAMLLWSCIREDAAIPFLDVF